MLSDKSVTNGNKNSFELKDGWQATHGFARARLNFVMFDERKRILATTGHVSLCS
jgi:hypothetical protein